MKNDINMSQSQGTFVQLSSRKNSLLSLENKILKYYYVAIIIMIPLLNYSQKNSSKAIDTTSIVIKAKLFTISKYEYEKKEELISNLEKMPFTIYSHTDFLFIKIKSSYYCLDKNELYTENWCNCDYYVGYSIKNNRFYLLGGFVSNDFKAFHNDFKKSNYSVKINVNDNYLNIFLEKLQKNKIREAKNILHECKEL